MQHPPHPTSIHERKNLMEIVKGYRPILKNEVPVYREPMNHLFREYGVYVFGYGSLLTANGWLRRGMDTPPLEVELQECTLKGFERGPFGVFGSANYYGVVRNAKKECNGVIARIYTLRDWVNLMYTEHIAGLTNFVNYRVIDVTDNVVDIPYPADLRKKYKIHCVCNRPVNRKKALTTIPAYGYYRYVWDLINYRRSEAFVKRFLETGGFRNKREVEDYLGKE
jgi:hypothetical protein